MEPDDPAAVPPPGTASPPNRAPDAFREGEYLVVRKRGAMLPPGCVLCDGPEVGRAVLVARGPSPPFPAWFVVFSPLLVIARQHSPKAEFSAGLCALHIEKHLQRNRIVRRLLIPAIALLILLFAALWFGLPEGVVAATAFAAICLAFALAHISARQPIVLDLHHGDGRYMWVGGLSPEYLQQFQEIGGEN